MGMADIIPGVSGGTMALITGIYFRIIEALSSLTEDFFPRLTKLRSINDIVEAFRSVDLQLFIPLCFGIGIAMLAMSSFIRFFLEHYTAPTFALFFGLILGSAIILLKEMNGFRLHHIIMLLLGLCSALVVSSSTTAKLGHNYLIVLFSGMVAICAMILPGISGAFILLLLNQYEYLLTALNNFRMLVILVFLTGAAIGLLLFSRVLRCLLHRFRQAMLAFLIGLMLGGLYVPVTRIAENIQNITLTVISGLFGTGLVFLVKALRDWRLPNKDGTDS